MSVHNLSVQSAICTVLVHTNSAVILKLLSSFKIVCHIFLYVILIYEPLIESKYQNAKIKN